MFKVNSSAENINKVNIIVREFRKRYPAGKCYMDTELNVADLAPAVFLDIPWEDFDKFEEYISTVVRLACDWEAFTEVSIGKMAYDNMSSLVEISEGVC